MAVPWLTSKDQTFLNGTDNVGENIYNVYIQYIIYIMHVKPILNTPTCLPRFTDLFYMYFSRSENTQIVVPVCL